tara:strand:- start:186 stop:782 length:597 start_codon:yes stop_codon:yes gene_type:complete
MRDKIILTDADGVMLDWEFSFTQWMKRHGHFPVRTDCYSMGKRYNMSGEEALRYIREFNSSANIGFIPPLRDSIKYIRKLHEEHGFIFHCITSVSEDPHAKRLREQNIHNLFGVTPFERIVCLDTGAPKHDVLKEYEGSDCFWIEDMIDNAQAGLEAGLDPILMSHEHNTDRDHPEFTVVKNWREIYDIVVGETNDWP